MTKRPTIDLAALTAEAAAPMTEAVQRMPPATKAPPQLRPEPHAEKPKPVETEERVRTENLQALAFKVPPAFRRRFRQRAADADLKLNELLFEALDAWEAGKGLKK
jgi:hypothetical protein